jgi:hypothetical protein
VIIIDQGELSPHYYHVFVPKLLILLKYQPLLDTL